MANSIPFYAYNTNLALGLTILMLVLFFELIFGKIRKILKFPMTISIEIALMITILWFFHKNSSPPPQSYNVSNKIILITGSNKGIGYASAQILAENGATVIITSRDESRARYSASLINSLIKGSGRAIGMGLNLSSFKEIKKFAEKIAENFEKLDVLVFNAGMVSPDVIPLNKTIDGIEESFAVNAVSNQLLVKLLLPLMKGKTEEKPRIITVSSLSYLPAQYDFFDDFSTIKSDYMAGQLAYARSKAANIMFASHLSKLEEDVLSFSINPGAVRTDMTNEHFCGSDAFIYPYFYSKFMLDLCSRLFFRNIYEGSSDIVFLASAPQNLVEDLNSEFIQNGKPFPISWRTDLIRNESFAEILWDKIDQIISPFH